MYRNRRTYVTCLAAAALALTCLAVLVVPDATLTGGLTAAQTTTPTPSPTPWQTDPLGSPGNYTLFRNDNLFIAGQVAYPDGTYSGNNTCDNPGTTDFNNRSFDFKQQATAPTTWFYDAANVPQQASGRLANLRMVGGAGHIINANKEQGVLYKLSDFQGSNVGQATYSVELFDKTGGLYTHKFPAVQAGVLSFLDVATGDLDRLRDANDQYQDEVVLVSESGNKTVQLTVMSFLNAADASWTDCAQEGATCSFDGSRVVRYGANGDYTYGTFNGSVSCSNDALGSDPAPGDGKACAYAATWTDCAAQDATCTFDGTRRVRYGANGNYFYGTFTGSVDCSNGTFGDPAVGDPTKRCAYDAAWTNCAAEGGTCTFDGERRVRYGTNGAYNYGTFTGSVSCSNDAFGGDPAEGYPKTCDIQAPLTPLITTFTTNLGVQYYPDDPANDPDNLNKGGQISAAVGDFDGDGKMEIAVVNIAGTSLEMTIFRYTNDGQGNANFVVQDSRPIAAPVNRYVDIAAGDFTGAGHDQIIVGYVSGVPANDPQIHVDAWDFTTENGVIKASGEINGVAFGSARNSIGSQCSGSIRGCNDFITQPGWVQIKAGTFKYDPNNGYNTRRRQLGIIWGNSRPVFGIMEIAPNTTPALTWLPGAGPTNLDTAGGAYWVSRAGDANGEVPDTREAYSIMAGNFGDPDNPASLLGIVAPYLFSNSPSCTACSGFDYCFYTTGVGTAVYTYTQGIGTTDNPYSFSLNNVLAGASANTWVWTKRKIGTRGVAAVALDLDGNSLRLGAPARIVVDNLLTTDAVLQEPPKHLDWVCGDDDFLNPLKCGFVNVSRYKSFNITYTDADKSTTSNEIKSTADTSVGKSSAKTLDETFSAGIPDIASLDLDAEQKYETETDSKNSQENYNKSVSGTSFTYESATSQADQVVSRTRTLVVYRYPLYGKPDANNNGQQKFYDLTLPVETDIISSPGDTSEWYQPIHENGNLLTYPFTPQFDPSADYGFYTTAGQSTCSVTNSLPCRQNSDCPSGETCSGALPGLLGPPVTNTAGSNVTNFGITYDQAGTTGASLSTSQTLKSSEELKFGFKATWSLPLGDVDTGGSVGGSLQYNTNEESSWSNSTVSESTTSSSKGINLFPATSGSPYNYDYKTWAYITQGGFLKVAHAADITTTGGAAAWYAQTYGKYPDLSLNLPRKFLQDESNASLDGVFKLNTAIERKETKSIFLTDPDVKNLDGSPSYIAGGIDVNPAVPAGTNLLVNIRVYNLSTNVAIAGTDPNLFASIELATYDPATAVEGPHIPVGAAPIPAIPAYGGDCTPLNGDGSVNPNYPVCNSVVITGSVNGSTLTALGPGTYRLYVVLDPANALPNEYHEWQDRRNDPLLQVPGDPDPTTPVDDNVNPLTNQPSILEKGQNNEGWIYLNVVAQSLDTVSNRTPELSMPQNGLAADVFAAEPDAVRPRANIHTPVRIRARIDSDGDNLGHQHVMFFDQDPDQGGKPFAIRLLRGVTKGANYAWVTYTPRQLGRQTIWARVVEHAADTKPGNHTTSVVLIVRPADKQPPRLFVTVTPAVLFPPDDRMVEVAATVLAADNQDRAPRVRLEAITYNAGNDASADISGAAFGTDDRQFALRAKRGTRGEGPVIYEVVYSATDRAGNKAYAKAYVTVPRGR